MSAVSRAASECGEVEASECSRRAVRECGEEGSE